jgi:TonB family protein
MKHRIVPLMMVIAAACSFAVIENASAQSAQTSDAPPSGVVLLKLSDPIYPRLAQQARIAGEVDLMLGIRRDGTFESAVVVSGHPMLKQAALDSAQRSQFECVGCGEAVNLYALKYKFQIAPRDPPRDCNTHTEEKRPPAEVDLSRH